MKIELTQKAMDEVLDLARDGSFYEAAYLRMGSAAKIARHLKEYDSDFELFTTDQIEPLIQSWKDRRFS